MAEDGPRLKHFRQALGKMLQASQRQCTSSEKIDETFAYSLTAVQIGKLEQTLKSEFETTISNITGGFEKTLELHELPPKLNQIDAFLRALPPDHQAEPRSDAQPEELVNASIVPAKLDMIEKLKAALAHAQSENTRMEQEVLQRKVVVEGRVNALKNIRNKYVEAFNYSADVNVIDLETMIDRMTHQQTVPLKHTL